MEYLIASMQKKYELVKGLSDKVPAMANNFLTIKSQLEGMVENPYSIARKVGDLTSSQESLSNWYLSLQSRSAGDRLFLKWAGRRKPGKVKRPIYCSAWV